MARSPFHRTPGPTTSTFLNCTFSARLPSETTRPAPSKRIARPIGRAYTYVPAFPEPSATGANRLAAPNPVALRRPNTGPPLVVPGKEFPTTGSGALPFLVPDHKPGSPPTSSLLVVEVPTSGRRRSLPPYAVTVAA